MKRTIGILTATLMFALCSAGGLVLMLSLGDEKGTTPAIGTTPSAPAARTPVPAKTKKPSTPTIQGDDVVHVGEDAPAGTYRTQTAIEEGSTCYWAKSSDAEGAKILDNGIPQGGRPQVTLKAGVWFTSQGGAPPG